VIEVEEIIKLKSIYLLDKFKGIINQNDNYLVCQKIIMEKIMIC